MSEHEEHHHHSYSEVWRRFEEHPLTHSMAHYLMAISELRAEHGYARATDVAKRLGVTKGSASIALKTIREKGFISEDENRVIFLTKRGEAAVHNIVGSRAAFLQFFHDILAVDENQALEDACKLEHLVSHITTERLIRFTLFLQKSRPARKLIEYFREYVSNCTDVEHCGRCETVEECAERFVTRVEGPKRGKEAKKRLAKKV
jgi:DtxR family transcriptional regulator, Mn-dependent transcriptional regulator